ncbi:MAG: hypothetical protein AAB221_14055, partial [Bacteroidota bacterium]
MKALAAPVKSTGEVVAAIAELQGRIAKAIASGADLIVMEIERQLPAELAEGEKQTAQEIVIIRRIIQTAEAQDGKHFLAQRA